MNALELKNLSKTYKGFKLQNVSLELPQGCIMGLIGENGAGKTTVIKLILDIVKKDSGQVYIMGKDVSDGGFKELKEDIGVVLDDVGCPECITPKQFDRIMEGTFKRWNGENYRRLIDKFGLEDNKKFGEMSKGMKMKMGIAAAMSHGAKLLILDEATSGLDPVARDEVIDMLYEYTRDPEHSVLISSHIVTDLEKLCDYICFLKDGQVVLLEEKDAILEKYGIVRCSGEALKDIDPAAVVGVKRSPYGVEAAVKKAFIPAGMTVGRLGIEELFVFMAKEEN
jgi:ABC-2 type transport system ATP-binding protein